jgi:hypothetical protein
MESGHIEGFLVVNGFHGNAKQDLNKERKSQPCNSVESSSIFLVFCRVRKRLYDDKNTLKWVFLSSVITVVRLFLKLAQNLHFFCFKAFLA